MSWIVDAVSWCATCVSQAHATPTTVGAVAGAGGAVAAAASIPSFGGGGDGGDAPGADGNVPPGASPDGPPGTAHGEYGGEPMTVGPDGKTVYFPDGNTAHAPLPPTSTDPNATPKVVYDPNTGLPASVTSPDGTGVPSANAPTGDPTPKVVYDPNTGLPASVTNPDGTGVPSANAPTGGQAPPSQGGSVQLPPPPAPPNEPGWGDGHGGQLGGGGGSEPTPPLPPSQGGSVQLPPPPNEPGWGDGHGGELGGGGGTPPLPPSQGGTVPPLPPPPANDGWQPPRGGDGTPPAGDPNSPIPASVTTYDPGTGQPSSVTNPDGTGVPSANAPTGGQAAPPEGRGETPGASDPNPYPHMPQTDGRPQVPIYDPATGQQIGTGPAPGPGELGYDQADGQVKISPPGDPHVGAVVPQNPGSSSAVGPDPSQGVPDPVVSDDPLRPGHLFPNSGENVPPAAPPRQDGAPSYSPGPHGEVVAHTSYDDVRQYDQLPSRSSSPDAMVAHTDVTRTVGHMANGAPYESIDIPGTGRIVNYNNGDAIFGYDDGGFQRWDYSNGVVHFTDPWGNLELTAPAQPVYDAHGNLLGIRPAGGGTQWTGVPGPSPTYPQAPPQHTLSTSVSPESPAAPNATEGNDVTLPKAALHHEVPAAPVAPPDVQFHTPHVLNLDGTTSTHYPDGTQDVRAPDGRCWRIAPTGNIVHAWQEPPVPQWHPPEPVAGTQPDGGTVVYHPDGSKDLWRDGRQTMRFDPNGRPTR